MLRKPCVAMEHSEGGSRRPPQAETRNKKVIAVTFSFGPKPAGAQLDRQTKVKETFDFAALAALLQ